MTVLTCCRQRRIGVCGKAGNNSLFQPANTMAIKPSVTFLLVVHLPFSCANLQIQFHFLDSYLHIYSHIGGILRLKPSLLCMTFSIYKNPAGIGSKHFHLAILTVCLLVWRPESMLRVCVCLSSTVTCVSPSPTSGLAWLSGVIPWKGMTEPQCLEMAALAAISSSKKRAH